MNVALWGICLLHFKPELETQISIFVPLIFDSEPLLKCVDDSPKQPQGFNMGQTDNELK